MRHETLAIPPGALRGCHHSSSEAAKDTEVLVQLLEQLPQPGKPASCHERGIFGWITEVKGAILSILLILYSWSHHL